MKKRPQLTKVLGLSALILTAAFFIINYLIWQQSYKNTIYPGISIGGLDLSGKTLGEARELIRQKSQAIESEGLIFKYGGKQVALGSATIAFDSDLAYSAFFFDIESSAQAAYQETGERGFIKYLTNFIKPKNKKIVQAVYTLNNDAIKRFLIDSFPELIIAPENSYFSLKNKGAGEQQIQRSPERPGKDINYNKAIAEAINNLNNLQNVTINIETRSQYPLVTATDLNNLEPNIITLIKGGELLLRTEPSDKTLTNSWKVPVSLLVNWVSIQKTNNIVNFYFDQDKIKEYLSNNIAPEINKEVVLPRFEIKNGRVTSWQTGQNGSEINLDVSAKNITNALLQGQHESILISQEILADQLNPENNLQIKEKIGTGFSSFTGSSASRRHNISTGANSLHGLLIKPGEEFSLIKALGDISAETGYLPELVIKGDKTVPEFGGGLCQVGTTIFRTALASGLPITMRQNHSYRVSYYEPAGTDATIYVPQPDLRFINDTGNYILIQARLEKNDLYFDFWGTKDGRVATTTAPVIYNIVKPEPTKIIESDSLKPGEKKCTESSHNGADAYFDYKVIYPEGSTSTPIQERRFKSHYVPWQGVCLIGKAAVVATSTASSSTEIKKAADESTASSTE